MIVLPNLGSNSIHLGFKYFSAIDYACLLYWNKLYDPNSVNPALLLLRASTNAPGKINRTEKYLNLKHTT